MMYMYGMISIMILPKFRVDRFGGEPDQRLRTHTLPQPSAQAHSPVTAPTHNADNWPLRHEHEMTTAAAAGPRIQHVRELDWIDEQDETDSFGSEIHHHGPYEDGILGDRKAGGSAYGSAYGV